MIRIQGIMTNSYTMLLANAFCIAFARLMSLFVIASTSNDFKEP
jgi:hypothetical protein